MLNFGFGSLRGHDEVFVGDYKVFEIYADAPDKYRRALKDLGIPWNRELRTVWQNITQTSPGRRTALKEETNIWDMLDQLKRIGLYRAETRED
jgi:hypothetical protein